MEGGVVGRDGGILCLFGFLGVSVNLWFWCISQPVCVSMDAT